MGVTWFRSPLQHSSLTGRWGARGPSWWWCSESCCLTSLQTSSTGPSRPTCSMCVHIKTRREVCTTMLYSQVRNADHAHMHQHVDAHTPLLLLLQSSQCCFMLIYACFQCASWWICFECIISGYLFWSVPVLIASSWVFRRWATQITDSTGEWQSDWILFWWVEQRVLCRCLCVYVKMIFLRVLHFLAES